MNLKEDNAQEILTWVVAQGLAEHKVMYETNHYRLTDFGQDVTLLLFSLLGGPSRRVICSSALRLQEEEE